tara:strand:- start:9307 stop:9432 length:126 start_codon:yes stop_codon:yes gene_type:complete
VLKILELMLKHFKSVKYPALIEAQGIDYLLFLEHGKKQCKN